MRMSELVLSELSKQDELGFGERAVLLGVWAFQPKNISSLAQTMRVSRSLVTRACDNLVKYGWLRLSTVSRGLCPVPVIPRHCQLAMAENLEKSYACAPNRGEFLMKCRLDLIVRCDEFVDNARPKWLENPSTEAPLEYDRFYYLLKIAFEFNGSQHYGVTEVFNDEEVVNEGMKRDSVKEELSRQHGIKLVVVTPDDLIPGRLEQLLPPELPRFSMVEEGPFFATLARICSAYSARAARA
ncbi:MAG TPA: hypothetical protein GXX23_04035 [Firmicutes bacterium]|nr:hypothetical protein [Candidatus Fermentithermobacillaceae bacterium]